MDTSYAYPSNYNTNTRGFGASGAITYFVGACGPVYKDGGWEGPCNAYGPNDTFAWYSPVLTVEAIFFY